MPILLVMIVGISIFSMTLSHSDADGVTRTGLQGLKVYLVPNFSGMTLKDFVIVFVDALGTAVLLDQCGDGYYGNLWILRKERDQSDAFY